MTTTAPDQGTAPYARCTTCGVDLQTAADQSQHMTDTLNDARQADPQAAAVSGHTTTVVNPTPEEVEARRRRGIVTAETEDAMNRACGRLDDEVRRGRITEEQVTEELRWYPDFSDAWADWLSEVNR